MQSGRAHQAMSDHAILAFRGNVVGKDKAGMSAIGNDEDCGGSNRVAVYGDALGSAAAPGE